MADNEQKPPFEETMPVGGAAPNGSEWNTVPRSPDGRPVITINKPVFEETDPVDTSKSLVQKAFEPITSYPETYNEMNREAREQMARGAGQISGAFEKPSLSEGAWEAAKGIANVGSGGLGFTTSPISAGYRTLLGKPVEEITGIPKEYTEFTASLLTPGIGLTRFPRFNTSPLPPATEAEKIVNAAERIGFEIPKAAVVGPTWQTVAGAVKEVPIIGAPIVKSSKKALSDIENAVQETARKYGALGTEDAGLVAKEAIEGWFSGKGESGKILEKLYDKVDNFVDPLYTRQLDSTADTISKIMAERANAKMSGRSPAVDEVLNAVQSAEGMNYEGLKTLRSYIGKMTPEEMVAKNINQTEAKRIYGALTDDLKKTILVAGSEEATKMFDYASSVARIIADKREQLSKIIGTKADVAPEKVISRIESMATGKSSADIQKLRDVKHAIGDGAWNEVAGTILNKMGRTAEDAAFSGDRFVTKFDNMSANARNLLFGNNPELYGSVKDLVDVSKSFKNLNKLGNPSGTGRVSTILTSSFGSFAATAAMFTEPVTTIVSLITSLAPAISVAKYMASPAKVKQASAFGKAYNNAMFNPTAANLVVLDTASRAFNKTLEDTQEAQPRATGGSVFDKMHMARKRAEGGGTDAPFNEWDAVPRNAEGIPQIRIQKPPVNEADEAQAAREVAHDPNNIGMSEADHGGFASTGKKLSEGIIPKMFDAIVGEPSRQMKPTGWPAGSEEDDYLNAVKRRDAMYWGPDMALNMVGIGGPLAMMNAGKNAIGIAGGRGLTAFKKDTGDFLSKNNLPAITPEQNLANIKSRIRQIEYDRRLSKIDGEAYPNNPELTSLRSRARELGNPALPMDSGFLLGSGTKDKTTGKAVAAEQLANALEQPNAPTLPNKRASAEDINRAADESAGMTQAELRALYNELGITGTPPSSLVKTALADQPKSAIDAATSMKLEDIAAMNKLSKKDRELFVKGKLPNFVLPSQEAAAPARIEFDKVRKEIKKAETEFDLLRATGDEPRLFDLSSKALNKVPDVDQFRLPRVEPKITERLQPAYAGGAGLKRLERAAEKASSADYGWYQLQQIRDMMNSVHGPKKGEMVWNAWLDSLAGTSMVNPISSNVRGSTYYLREALSGRPLPQSIPVVDPKTGNVRWTLAGAPEAGYGAKAQIQHADRVREFMAHEGDPIANPKPMSYRQNLGGNWKPRTVDTHDIRNAVGMPHAVTFGENAGLLPGEYAALEQLGEKAASRSGVPQAAQQAATWIGGGAYTKLKSIPIPLLNEINRRIHVTAKINGVAPDVLWRNVLRGKEILKFAGGSVLDKMKRASK